MVREEDAAALVVIAAQGLALRGHAPKVTHENGPRLMQLGALMIDAFGIGGGERTQDNGMHHEGEDHG